jgi:molybdenum ABC transporter molybdate-binding protein
MTILKGWLSGLLLTVSLAGHACAGETLRIAVAANFKPAMDNLVSAFRDSGNPAAQININLSTGSTGALYAQVLHGAPYDLFFAADTERPEQLVLAGRGLARESYAIGRLVFWHPRSEGQSAKQRVERHNFENYSSTLAIANPRHAPYGRAAMEAIRYAGVRPSRLIQGMSIAQTFAFVQTGNAPAGLVALSQVLLQQEPAAHYWLLPSETHQPIEQHYVLLTENADAMSFLAFLETEIARNVIKRSGYALPGDIR